MTRAFAGMLAMIALLAQASSQLAAQPPQPLNFFKSYLITGDYAVRGIGLRDSGNNGLASGDINIATCADSDSVRTDCVPKGVDVVAAFLYWQVIGDASDPRAGARNVRFHGQPLSLTEDVEILLGKSVGLGSPPCWSNGGGTGGGSGQNNLTYSYRADVLRFLEIDAETGKTAGYGAHPVTLPDTRRAAALGASLVVVYRASSLPYSAIVLYDGTYSMANATPGMTLRMEGFYEADDVNTAGKITHIVGSGQASKGETVYYNDQSWANRLNAAEGDNWDNPTFPVTVDPSLRAIETGGRPPASSGSFDCLTWAAVVYRTPLNDDDEDGLLNRWETSSEPILDPYGRALPPLSKMGADPNVKDIFMEVNYMKTDVARAYGGDVQPAHSHLPDPEAVRLFGDMFKARGINVHLDLGPTYDAASSPGAEAYLVRDSFTGEGLARGGEFVDETATVCEAPAGSPPWICQFSGYPGTIGWKSGLRRLRDSFVNTPVVPPGQDDPCDVAGSTCERRFDEVRQDIFRYALFAHFIGLPKSNWPCLDAGLKPVEDVNGVCPAGAGLNPDFRVPRTYSGIGDFPGGDLVVSLGGFKDAAGRPVGTPFMQASTLAHEFGHTGERRHGGEASEPNCKPAYLSVMNYLYQLRGLLDDNGKPHLGFSDDTLFGDVDESAVQDGMSSTSTFRLGWYAPLDFSYLKDRRPPARARCDGSALGEGERLVRIDARASADPLDWNANDAIDDTSYAQDVNFNGRVNGSAAGAISGPLKGFSDDWTNLKLNQVGSRRNVGGLYRKADGTLAVGPLSLDVGKLDLGPNDLGKLDLAVGKLDLDAGKLDLDSGKLDLGKLDLNMGKLDLDAGKLDLDLGAAESGSGDQGRGDFGGGDLNVNDPDNPLGEIDATTAAELARTPPNEFQVCVVGPACAATGATLHDVVARFTAPNIGGVASFTLYRVEGPTLRPGLAWTLVAAVQADPAQPQAEPYEIIDGTELEDGRTYTYFAIATYAADGFQNGIESDPSTLGTITAVNAALVAGADGYTIVEDTTLTIAAPGVLDNDGDEDSPATLEVSLLAGPAHGTLVLNANGSFTYTPAANFNGTDGFTYRPAAGSSVVGIVTINVTPNNDAPTIAGLPTQPVVINQDTTAGPLGLTVADEEGAAALVLTGSSSNTTLVPNAGIVFGGSGTARTVSVTPVAGQAGSATITVRATDAGGLTAEATFMITVNATTTFTFVNVKNAPSPAGTRLKAGSAIPMQWRYSNGTADVDSSALTFSVTVAGPTPAVTTRNTDTGSSNFRYQASSKTWVFNLQTKETSGATLPVGTYVVTIVPSDARYQTQVFDIVLVK